ncbi:MAG: hypothetical protein JSS67_12195 [Bacteroidetes bacterium]|nr:hypothetical protein [Bacteroidota bacterium]
MNQLSHEDIEQINNMKNYLDQLPLNAQSKKAYCFRITVEDIQKLLSQSNNGHDLDGLRIYLGAHLLDGSMVPNIHIIACEKDEDDCYNDFIPASEDSKKQVFPLVAHGRPCPTDCTKKKLV